MRSHVGRFDAPTTITLTRDLHCICKSDHYFACIRPAGRLPHPPTPRRPVPISLCIEATTRRTPSAYLLGVLFYLARRAPAWNALQNLSFSPGPQAGLRPPKVLKASVRNRRFHGLPRGSAPPRFCAARPRPRL